jgi:carotenoid cleavage dioxygenase
MSSRRDFLASAALLAAGATRLGATEPSAGKPAWPDSPFLQGGFAPVAEEVTADDLPVVGKLPAGLEGMYVRNGPNPQFPPKGKYHWFDGDGMLHGVRLAGGKASYRNRYILTAGLKAERKADKALWGGLLDPPDLAALARGEGMKNVANTALVWHDGRLLALWEAGAPHEVRLPDLATVGTFDYGGKLKHPFTAHPKLDPATGEMFFFGYAVGGRPFAHYSVADARGRLVRTVPLDLPRPVMMHDFAVTEKYAVFLDLPEVFDVSRVFLGESVLQWQPKHGARIGLLNRDGSGKVRWFDIPVCYVFHTLSAWDDGDTVVLHACRMPEFPGVLMAAGKRDPAREPRSALCRWRIDTREGTVKEEIVDDLPADFPRIPDALVGRRHRFGYAAASGGETFSGWVKYDLQKGTRELHSFGKGRAGGEGVFVPRPGGTAEDDGWLVGYVHDAAERRSEFVVVDCRDFTGKPLARVTLPARVPHGFHGIWVGEDRLPREG